MSLQVPTQLKQLTRSPWADTAALGLRRTGNAAVGRRRSTVMGSVPSTVMGSVRNVRSVGTRRQ